MLFYGYHNFFSYVDSVGIDPTETRSVKRIESDIERGKTTLILGILMFLPGSYGSFMLFMAWRGVPGYEYSMVPSYDE